MNFVEGNSLDENSSQSNALKKIFIIVFLFFVYFVLFDRKPIKRMLRLWPQCNFYSFFGYELLSVRHSSLSLPLPLPLSLSLPLCLCRHRVVCDFLVSGLQLRLIVFWPDVVFVILPHRAVRLFWVVSTVHGWSRGVWVGAARCA